MTAFSLFETRAHVRFVVWMRNQDALSRLRARTGHTRSIAR